MRVKLNQAGRARQYWNSSAESYDQSFSETLVGRLWRESVWRELDPIFRPGERVLELNCGTGIDAIHLASRGISVVACDISDRMIDLALARSRDAEGDARPEFRVLATEEIGKLRDEALFDGAFSNFSGLNCVEDLSSVRRNLARLLKPGARILFCMLGKFSPWEITWYLAHGDCSTAFRALRQSNTKLATNGVQIRYPSRKKIAELLAPEFRLLRWRGLGIAMPPSYVESWARRFPRLTTALYRLDRVIGGAPVFRNMGGCILLHFERTGRSGEL